MSFTAPIWQLSSIITELRLITGRPDTSMISDQQCANLINYYYQYVLPKELKIFWGYTYYQFFCQANVDQYLAPAGFQTVNPGATADGWDLTWYTDPNNFYEDYPQQNNQLVVATGDGSTNSFNYNVAAYPVLPRSLYVTDGTQIAQDNGSGGFIDPNNGNAPLAGAVDYITGTVTGQAFATAPVANANITASSFTYMAARPQSILFFKQAPLVNSTSSTLNGEEMFVLRPVPDQVYQIKMQGIQVPPPLINNTDIPFRPDLGPLIALGAAIQLFKQFNQFDQIQQITPEFMRYKDICMQDTYEELLYTRSVPAF